MELVAGLLVEHGLPRGAIYSDKARVVLPGYYRPTKEWDLLVVLDGELLAALEFKSHIGPSFGNNYNNRTEEALGSATDLWTAFRDGAFRESPRPWLGYFMLLEDHRRSRSPVAVKEPHFEVFQEFEDASYAERYDHFCRKLVRERLYDAACFLLLSREAGLQGEYQEPSPGRSFARFAGTMVATVCGQARVLG